VLALQHLDPTYEVSMRKQQARTEAAAAAAAAALTESASRNHRGIKPVSGPLPLNGR